MVNFFLLVLFLHRIFKAALFLNIAALFLILVHFVGPLSIYRSLPFGFLLYSLFLMAGEPNIR